MQKSSNEEMGLNYWMKWQVLVCGLIIALPTALAIKYIKSKPRNPESHNLNQILWVSCWKNLNPKWLLLYRALAFLSMAFLLCQMILFSGFFAFYFYTQWTFALVMVYFGLGTIVSARGCLRSSKTPTENTENDKFLNNSSEGNGSSSAVQSHDSDNVAKETPGMLECTMDIIYQISAGASVLTDLVFWCILVPMLAGKEFEVTLLIGLIHSLNAIYLAVDSLFNSLPFEWFGFAYFIIWSATYITFQWILRACGSTWWPYPFLDLSTPVAPLWYLGLALIHVPCYGVYYLFVKAKNAIFSKLFEGAFVMRSNHQKAA